MKPIYIIFFLMFGVGLIPQVFATHYSDYGIDDKWYWREWDVDPVTSVWCEYHGTEVYGNYINIECEGGSYEGDTRQGALMFMKTFPKSFIHPTTATNAFTYGGDNTCSETTCEDMVFAIMDGTYTHSSYSVPGGFIPNADYNKQNNGAGISFCSTPSVSWATDNDDGYCLGTTIGDLSNIFGGGDLVNSGSNSRFGTNPSGSKSTTFTMTSSITNALWAESTQSTITVFVMMAHDGSSSTNHHLKPNYFQITNTQAGTAVWNFPETVGEAALWNTYGGYGLYQLNGTDNDYGYFYSYDPSLSDPPTDLYAECSTDCDLYWTAPEFVGYNPLTAYKIERESPIGGGFLTLVANTGNLLTQYSDTTITPGTEYNYRVRALNSFGESAPSNESVDGTPGSGSSDPVNIPNVSCNSTGSSFELFAPGVGYNYVDLCWDTINMSGGNVTGYQINYTTPWGDPVTTLTGLNDTGTTDRTRRINNLQASTDYSFRVALWSDNTFNNQTNIVNVTTQSTAFNVGNYTFTGDTNTETLDFKWSKNIISANQTEVNVEFPTSYSVDCSINLLLAQTELNYTSISETTLTPSTSYHTFTFDDPDNDVIKISCWNSSTPEQVSNYVLTNNVSSIPLIEQIQNFRAGTWGTEGQVGAFDLITLIVIILSMLAFNRTNPVAGAIISLIILGVAAFFQIIQWYSAIGGLIAVGVVLALAAHNKGDTD